MIHERRVLSFALALALVFTAMVILPQSAAAYPEKPLPYRIHVSRSAQIVTVLDNVTGDVVRQMICSTGLASSPTKTGSFKMPKPRSDERKNWYVFSSSGSVWAHYASRIVGSYLFHSILYRSPSTSSLNRVSWTKLGNRASHGCVRLTPLDAQWIAYNCAAGTVVRINDAKPAGPIKTSSTIKRTLPSPQSNGILPGWEATLKPTPKPSEDEDPPTLDVGIEGPLTKAMQNQLQSLGYFTGTVNSKFGESTKNALINFQQAYLKAFPSTSSDTNADGLGTKAWQARVRDNKDNPLLASTIRTLSLSRKGTSVLALRQRLEYLGYTKTTPTTSFDAHTRDAINAFKRANGLKQDGKATKAVQDLLFDNAQTPLEKAYISNLSGVSLRRTASSNGALVAKIKLNAEVRIIREYGDWRFVVSGKKFGFVMAKHIQSTPV